jgi:hypothetical protein
MHGIGKEKQLLSRLSIYFDWKIHVEVEKRFELGSVSLCFHLK